MQEESLAGLMPGRGVFVPEGHISRARNTCRPGPDAPGRGDKDVLPEAGRLDHCAAESLRRPPTATAPDQDPDVSFPEQDL